MTLHVEDFEWEYSMQQQIVDGLRLTVFSFDFYF